MSLLSLLLFRLKTHSVQYLLWVQARTQKCLASVCPNFRSALGPPASSSKASLQSAVFFAIFASVHWFWPWLYLICAVVIASEQTEAGDSESDGSEFDLNSTTYLPLNPWANAWITWISIFLSAQYGKQYLSSQVCENEMEVITLSV